MKRLVALVPPRGLHLTCFHGVFAPNASLRAEVMLPSPLLASAAPQRTFGIDVWLCPCGGKRAVRAIVTNRSTAEAMLLSMGLAGAPTPRVSAQSPPQLALEL